MRRDDDDRRVVAPLAEPVEASPCRRAGHLEVEQDQVEGWACEPAQGDLAVLGLVQLGPGRFQGRAEHEPDVRLVVDDQDACSA